MDLRRGEMLGLIGPNGAGKTTCVAERGIVEFDAFPRLLGGFDSTTARSRWEPGGDDLDAAMLEEFLDAVRAGRCPQPDGEAGLRSLRIVLAAYASLRTGQPVRLPEPVALPGLSAPGPAARD
jgi:predicted dehydrogenase